MRSEERQRRQAARMRIAHASERARELDSELRNASPADRRAAFQHFWKGINDALALLDGRPREDSDLFPAPTAGNCPFYGKGIVTGPSKIPAPAGALRMLVDTRGNQCALLSPESFRPCRMEMEGRGHWLEECELRGSERALDYIKLIRREEEETP